MNQLELRASSEEFCRHIDAVGAELHQQVLAIVDRLAGTARKLDELETSLKAEITRQEQETRLLIQTLMNSSGKNPGRLT